jgi:mRNA interferase HicA
MRGQRRPRITLVCNSTEMLRRAMNATELRRLLTKNGCRLENHHGGSGHVTVTRGHRRTQLPMHGGKKDLGKGLVNKILKDLGIK